MYIRMHFLKRGASKINKGWNFPISGEYSYKLRTNIIVRKHWQSEVCFTSVNGVLQAAFTLWNKNADSLFSSKNCEQR